MLVRTGAVLRGCDTAGAEERTEDLTGVSTVTERVRTGCSASGAEVRVPETCSLGACVLTDLIPLTGVASIFDALSEREACCCVLRVSAVEVRVPGTDADLVPCTVLIWSSSARFFTFERWAKERHS